MQHGFTKCRLCQMNTIALFDKIPDSLDKGSAAHLLYLDFSKVSDRCHVGN